MPGAEEAPVLAHAGAPLHGAWSSGAAADGAAVSCRCDWANHAAWDNCAAWEGRLKAKRVYSRSAGRRQRKKALTCAVHFASTPVSTTEYPCEYYEDLRCPLCDFGGVGAVDDGA